LLATGFIFAYLLGAARDEAGYACECARWNGVVFSCFAQELFLQQMKNLPYWKGWKWQIRLLENFVIFACDVMFDMSNK